jgi:hypothetical protein
MFPEGFAGFIVGVEEYVALENSRALKLRETGFNEFLPDAAISMRLRDGEMMQITAPSIVAAENSADDFMAVAHDETHSAVSREELRDALARIAFVQADALRFLPQADDLIEIIQGHGFNSMAHALGFAMVNRKPERAGKINHETRIRTSASEDLAVHLSSRTESLPNAVYFRETSCITVCFPVKSRHADFKTHSFGLRSRDDTPAEFHPSSGRRFRNPAQSP